MFRAGIRNWTDCVMRDQHGRDYLFVLIVLLILRADVAQLATYELMLGFAEVTTWLIAILGEGFLRDGPQMHGRSALSDADAFDTSNYAPKQNHAAMQGRAMAACRARRSGCCAAQT